MVPPAATPVEAKDSLAGSRQLGDAALARCDAGGADGRRGGRSSALGHKPSESQCRNAADIDKRHPYAPATATSCLSPRLRGATRRFTRGHVSTTHEADHTCDHRDITAQAVRHMVGIGQPHLIVTPVYRAHPPVSPVSRAHPSVSPVSRAHPPVTYTHSESLPQVRPGPG